MGKSVNARQKNTLQTEVNNLIASLSEIQDVVMARKYVNFVKQGIISDDGIAISAYGKQENSLTLNILK
jgi:flagellin-like hook-associated protein FlgL